MEAWGVLLFVLAFTWTGVSADVRFDFPESFRGERIVSGWEAEPGQIPYQLSLRMVNPTGAVGGCGATLIHHEWALTAAHCTARRTTMVLRFGAVNLTRPALIFETTEYYNHPLYNEAMAGFVQPHDIGVIKLNRFVEYTDLIYPIRLQSSADMNKNYDRIRLQAAGWGRTWTGGASPENMNWVFLTGVTNIECWMAFGGSPIVVDSTICARYYNVTSQSTCQGDSGGSLVTIDYDGLETQVGVSSFVSSTGCHTPFPAGFIRPGHYHDWYYEVTGINFDWDRKEWTTTTEADSPTTEEVFTTPEEDYPTTEEVFITTEEDSPTTEEVFITTEEDSPTTEEVFTTTEAAPTTPEADPATTAAAEEN